MGRPPCCDKVGIKKGPWTPEEDIILVSYIQEHGPGNWRSVPTNTGLLRCSKSCRLRWTNYLRPGIKRGHFTPHEEGMIIHLQALLGNKWAAIASYLPQRTDNDIKNYWNTHLKKKLKKFQSALDPHNNIINNMPSDQSVISAHHHHHFLSNKSANSLSNETRILTLDVTSHSGSSSDHPPRNNNLALKNNSSSSSTANNNSSSTSYASSTENISRLLEGWMKSSPKANNNGTNGVAISAIRNEVAPKKSGVSSENEAMKVEEQPAVVAHEELESILSFDQNMMNNSVVSSWERSSSACGESTPKSVKVGCVAVEDHHHDDDIDDQIMVKVHHDHVVIGRNYSSKQRSSEPSSGIITQPPLSFLEKWLLDETSTSATAGQVEEMMELSPMF